MKKQTILVILLLVIVVGSAFGYSAYKTHQENQALDNLHQAAENALTQTNGLNDQLQAENAATQTQTASNTNSTNPAPTSATKIQTITDQNHLFSISIPASWTQGANMSDATGYEATRYDASTEGLSPYISVTVQHNNGEEWCEADVKTSTGIDSAKMASFSSNSTTISGAQMATMETNTDTDGRESIILYACTNGHSYIVTAGNLDSSIDATVQASLKTFKLN